MNITSVGFMPLAEHGKIHIISDSVPIKGYELQLNHPNGEFKLDGMKVTAVELLPAMLKDRLSVTIIDQTHAEFVTL